MIYLTRTLILLQLLVMGTYSQDLHFSMDTVKESSFCGRLFCWADKIFTNSHIFSVSVLTVFDVSKSNSSVRLASLSVYDSNLYVNPAKSNVLNVTGHISWKSAQLTLSLLDSLDCVNGSFTCEVDFVTVSGEPELIRETVYPGNTGKCWVAYEIAQETARLNTRVDDLTKVNTELEKGNLELKKQNDELDKENTELKEKLVHPQINMSTTCSNVTSYNNTRNTFLLWGKVPALCDTVTDGGGWIVIQRRTKGDVDFFRDWDDYKKGFGTPDTDFWIGNDIISVLTQIGYTELRIDMEFQGKEYFAHYSNFSVAKESMNYRLSVGDYTGTAGDSMIYHDGRQFSTYERDNDDWNIVNCAQDNHAGWWFNECLDTNLNGLWQENSWYGNVWGRLSLETPLAFSEMKIRSLD